MQALEAHLIDERHKLPADIHPIKLSSRSNPMLLYFNAAEMACEEEITEDNENDQRKPGLVQAIFQVYFTAMTSALQSW